MIDGNPIEFVDRIYSCQDTVFIFREVKYWFQGYRLPTGEVHMEIFQCDPPSETYLWECNGPTIEECQNEFLSAPIFAGKTFWQVEQEIRWVDA